METFTDWESLKSLKLLTIVLCIENDVSLRLDLSVMLCLLLLFDIYGQINI